MNRLTFYKPNPRNTGGAAQFNISQDKDKIEIYANLTRQVSWDDTTKKGTFKSEDPNNSVALKLNIFELGAIAHAITTNTAFSTVHMFQGGSTSIAFKPYTKKNGETAFGFSVIKNKEKYGIGIELSEAYVIKKFCDIAIEKVIGSGQS